MGTETDLSRAISKALQALGYIVVRVQSGKVKIGRPGAEYWVQLAEKGCPDRVVLGPGGVTTWLEIKTPKGKLSPDQKAWHARAEARGHRVRTVRSVQEAISAVNHSLCDHDGVPAADCARCAPDPLARKRPASMGMIALSEFDDL